MDNTFKFTSIFKKELAEYILFKRANGCSYGKTYVAGLLQMDIFFVKIQLQNKEITQQIVDDWMKECNSKNAKTTKGKYFSRMVNFCKYLHMLSYDNIITPESKNIRYKSEFIPYIFTQNEINKIFSISLRRSKENFKYTTFNTMLCLYYCCGLRFSEVHNLKMCNFIAQEQKIIIEKSKNDVTREIPLSKSVFDILNTYISSNTYKNDTEDIFIIRNSVKISENKVREMFINILKEAQIPLRYDGKRQRIHDLRHTFAVNCLQQMEVNKFDLYTSLSTLSVFLGHKSITETEYYLKFRQEDETKFLEQVHTYTQNIYENKEVYND